MVVFASSTFKIGIPYIGDAESSLAAGFTTSFAPRTITTSQVENSGLKVIGIHSLFFDQPHLGLFRGPDIRKNTIKFLIHLSNICADLGGKFLVFGSPQARKRDSLSINSADLEAISFFSELSNHIEKHGTYVVIESLGRKTKYRKME